jgi:hypothetical protein
MNKNFSPAQAIGTSHVSGLVPSANKENAMNTRYYVTLENGSEFLVWTGRKSLVDRGDGAHVVDFESVRDEISYCTCMVFSGDTLQSVHHFTGADARIVASIESRRLS